MPPPVKARGPRPPTPAVSPVDRLRRPETRSAMDPGTADVVRARTQLGNAAVTAAMGGLPRGAEPKPTAWSGQMLLAGQNLVGNQAIASQATALPAATSAGPAPVPQAPVKPSPAPKKPPPAKPTAQKTEAPSASAPDKKDLAKDKTTEERPEKGTKKEKGAGPRSPGADPKFQALKKDVNTKKKTVGASHPPAAAEAGAAQEAAEAPADDQEARGKAAHAEDMDAAKPKEFNKQEFIQAVKKAIAAKAPKNLDEADKFGESGKAEEVKTEVQGKVGEGKDASAQEIAETTAAPPEPAPDAKQVVPMAADKVPGKPGTPNPAHAAPDQLPPSATDMSAGPDQVNQRMTEAKVTEQQLSFDNSREPQFDKAVKEKKSLEAHSEAAPKKLRADESRELNQVKKTAATQGATAMGGIHATRVATGQQVGTGKQGTKKTDEDKRKEVTDLLQKVFDQTKCDVEKILSNLDKNVDDYFTKKEKEAREDFTSEHEEGMRRYKAKRYSAWNGGYLWLKDRFLPLPDDANRIYERARGNYLDAMDRIITDIATMVKQELRRAQDRIAAGRKDLKAAVDKLPKDLQAIGREAATEFEGKFDELKDTVNDKGTELVDTLATKYTDAVKAVDEEIAAEKEKNKGWVAKAADAIGGAIKAILELGRMLMGVLRKAVSAIGAILKDPIGFLSNLVKGVGGGLKLFMKNAGRHLQGGVLAWLLGTGGAMGLQLPRTFDILGILTLIAMMLGISWANIRARLIRRVPDQAVAAAETAVPLVSQVQRRGVAGMWDDLKARVGDLKKTLISNLVSFLLPTIIIAGITWIVSLFNPASAFIRACKMIIDIIRFIVTNARQIIDFVNAVLDAVLAIARGGTGGVPALVERALVRAIPVLIGALAALLGIGGIAGKVKQIFQKIARPVNRAIDWVINKMVGLIKKLWQKLKSKLGKKKPDKDDKRTRLRKALDVAVRVVNRFRGKVVRMVVLKPLLAAIRLRYRLTKLRPVPDGERWSVYGAASPGQKKKTQALTGAGKATDGDFDPEKKFAAELAKTHPRARQEIIKTLRALVGRKRISKTHRWPSAQEKIKGAEKVSTIDATPLNQDHTFGKWAHGEARDVTLAAMKDAQAAASTEDEKKRIEASLRLHRGAINKSTAEEYVIRYKAQVHQAAKPFNGAPTPVELLRELIWLASLEAKTFARLQETMLQRVQMGAAPEPKEPLPEDVRAGVLRRLEGATLRVTTKGSGTGAVVEIELAPAKAKQITSYLRQQATKRGVDPKVKEALEWWEDHILQPEWHHAWPQWLGGDEHQTKIYLPRVLHNFDGISKEKEQFPGGFHQILNGKIEAARKKGIFVNLKINKPTTWTPYAANAQNVRIMSQWITDSYKEVFDRFKAKQEATNKFVNEAKDQMDKRLKSLRRSP